MRYGPIISCGASRASMGRETVGSSPSGSGTWAGACWSVADAAGWFWSASLQPPQILLAAFASRRLPHRAHAPVWVFKMGGFYSRAVLDRQANSGTALVSSPGHASLSLPLPHFADIGNPRLDQAFTASRGLCRTIQSSLVRHRPKGPVTDMTAILTERQVRRPEGGSL